MKIYRIDFNKNDYDQYDAFIVRAENEESVEKLIKNSYSSSEVDWSGGFTVKEILQDGEEEVILGSFNAG